MKARAAAGILTAGLMAACATTAAPKGGPVDAAEALARLQQGSTDVVGIRGFASVTAWDAEQTFKGKLLVFAQGPDRVRIEVLSPFDQPISYLASDGRELQVYLLQEGRLIKGPATAANIAKLLPMRVQPGVLVEGLLGRPPLPRSPGAEAKLRWDAEASVYVLRYQPDGPEAWLSAQDLRPIMAGWLQAGETRGWTLELWEHQGALPRRLAFEHRPSGSGFRLSWDEVEILDTAMPSETWRIDVPPGVQVESTTAPTPAPSRPD